MSSALFNFLGRLLPSLKRSSVLEDIDITKKELNESMIPSYSELGSHFQLCKMISPEMKKIETIFYQEFKFKGGKQSNLFAEIALRSANLSANLEYVESSIEKIFERDVVREGLTAKKAILLRCAETFGFITRYAMDLADYAFWYEAKAANSDISKDYDVSPIKIKRIEKGIRAFARSLTDLTEKPDYFRSQLVEIPEVHLSEKDRDTISSLYSPAKMNPFESSMMVSGFTYSPVYHARLLIAEWQASRYHSIKDKKRALSVKLLYLKELHDKTSTKNPQLEEEIKYLQKRVDGYDRDLAEMERDVNKDD